METVWRITRRLLFLFVTLVVASNTIAFFVLNNSFIHDWFGREANERFFNQHGLSIGIGTITVNFLETKLVIRDVRLTDATNDKLELLGIESVTLGFDPWNPVVSWIPRSRFLSLEGWSFDTRIQKYLPSKENNKAPQKFDLNGALESARILIGQQLELKNGQVKSFNKDQIVTDLKIRNVFFKYNSKSITDGITLLLDADKSQICLSENEECSAFLPLESLSLNLVYAPEKDVRFERLDVRGVYGNWIGSGEVSLSSSMDVQNYQLRVQGDADAAPWFKLGGMEGRGRYSANLLIKPETESSSKTGRKNIRPAIEGKVSWQNIVLSGYDIYSGSADFTFSDKTIRYQNALITTEKGATIEARGEYSLRDKMSYSNSARLRDLAFTELMTGLGVPTNTLDFKMTSDALTVSGELNPNPKRGFTLLVYGPVVTKKMSVPGFESSKHKLPECSVNLRLETDSHKMGFEGSSALCSDEKATSSSEFILQKGLIDYDNSLNDFRFTGKSAPASLISYFLDEEIKGRMDLRASITSSRKKSVLFKSQVQLNDGGVFGLSVPRISGVIEIDENGFRGYELEGWLQEDRQSPNIVGNYVSVGFKNKALEIDGRFDGLTSEVLSVLGADGKRIAPMVEGSAQILKLKLRGNYRDISNSSIDVRLRLKNLVSPALSSQDLQATFLCQNGWCSGSRIYAQDVTLGKARITKPKNSDGKSIQALQSRAIIEIDSISNKSIAMRADLQSLPFLLNSENGKPFAGKLDLRGNLQGGRKDWELSAVGRMDGLSLGETPLGSVVATASSHNGGPLNIILSGIFDQAQARLVVDHSMEQSTQIYMSLRSLEIFKYIPALNRGELRTTGSVTAELSATGPGLKKMISSGTDVLEEFMGRGQVSKMRVQVGSEGFTLTDPVSIQLEQGELSFSPAILRGVAGEIRSSGNFSLAESELAARIEGQLDVSMASNLTSAVTQANGNISVRGQLSVSPEGTRFRGDAKLENIFLAGKYFSPPINALNGRLIFQDSRIEIPSLTAAKGNGQIEVVGAIDIQPDGELPVSEQEPSIALRANIRSAQFRWPQDIFETVETSMDGQIELVGRGKPYLVNGDLRISKGRAYKDATCQELLRVGSSSSAEASIANQAKPFAQLNLGLEADNSFTLQTSCIRGRISAALKITGSETEPVVAGQIRLDNGQLNLLKTRFEVTRADAIFDNLVRIEPRLDAQMVAKIERYNVFVGAEGPLSRPRLNIWSDPSTGPDGMPLSRPTLIRMISTNRGPGETTQTAVTQALANGVVGFFDDPLSQAVSRITRGFVDRFELQPILESGQSSWRARVSRDLGEKFNLGLDFEPNSQSLTGEIFINESVNVLGGFDRRSTQIGTYSELKGGFRFQFGGK